MDPWEKSETVDPEVRAYVYSLVNAVGGRSNDGRTYEVGDDAVAALRDLTRWLKLYDEKTGRMDVKRCLAEANLVKGDLLEILGLWTEEKGASKLRSKLALSCLELLTPLTWPLELDIENATVNHHRHVPYLQLAQVGYKRAVLNHDNVQVLRTVVRLLLPAMAKPRRDRSRREESIIRLGMIFLRNIAMITQPQHLPSQGDENEIGRSATIEAFHLQDVFTLLLTIGSGISDEFTEQDVFLLEILFHLVKAIDPKKLFMRKEQVVDSMTSELKSLLSKEKAMIGSYNKHAPTRHNRFGTMLWVKREDARVSTVSGQTSITNESATLQQMDSSKKWNKPRFRGKTAQENNEQSEIGTRVELTDSARKHLRTFVEDFLDSSFNPLFASLRKALASEADRVQESMHVKQYFYLASWFLSADAARREHNKPSNAPQAVTDAAPTEDNVFAYIAAVLDQETFVLLNRKMQTAFDNKEWQDLQATLMCFTQILLTVQSMTESRDEEDQEIGENILNRIFYEEATHDRMVQILRGYSRQGFAYLDAVTECVHVFVRMLEKYSKQNVDLQIRSKRRARKKQKEQNGEDGQGEDEVALRAQDEQEAHLTVSERKFDFARFSAKFLTQGCVDTFVELMQYHNDLTPEQLKRCHRYLYRLAFKHDLGVMLFRVDILQLLYQMTKGPGRLDPAMEGFSEWEQLVQQIFRRCFKWMDRVSDGQGWKEAAAVELLFSKIPSTVHYLQNGFDKVVETRAPRPPAELEVKASVPEGQRIAVAVSMMIEQAKADALEWIKKSLTVAADERKAWEDLNATRATGEEGGEEISASSTEAPSIFLTPDTDERKQALFKDKHLRLLLTTLGIQRLGLPEDTDASWIIPGHLTSEQLSAAATEIQKVEFDPPTFENDKTAADLIRLKSAGRRGARFSDHSDDDDDEDGDGPMFPANLKEKRQAREDGDEAPRKRRKRNTAEATELTEEELAARAKARRDKEREKNAKIKSRLFVTESDDESDAEGDEEFFRLEEERRQKTAGLIRSALLKQMDDDDEAESNDGNKKRKTTKTKQKKPAPAKKKRKGPFEDESDVDMSEVSANAQPTSRAIAISDDDEDEMSSEDDASASGNDDRPAKRKNSRPVSDNEEGEEDDDKNSNSGDAPLTSPPAVGSRRRRNPTTTETTLTSPLKELSSNVVPNNAAIDDDDDDEEPVVKRAPVSSAPRRNVRAGFVIDDDDDDE